MAKQASRGFWQVCLSRFCRAADVALLKMIVELLDRYLSLLIRITSRKNPGLLLHCRRWRSVGLFAFGAHDSVSNEANDGRQGPWSVALLFID
jgi:hypothetical protein